MPTDGQNKNNERKTISKYFFFLVYITQTRHGNVFYLQNRKFKEV